jgi:hypothetical protein
MAVVDSAESDVVPEFGVPLSVSQLVNIPVGVSCLRE